VDKAITRKEEAGVEKIAYEICRRLDNILVCYWEVWALSAKALRPVGLGGMEARSEAIHTHGGHTISWRRLAYTYARIYDNYHEYFTAHPDQTKQAGLSMLEKLLRVEDPHARQKLLQVAIESRWSSQRVETEVQRLGDGRPLPASMVVFEVEPAADQVGHCHDALSKLEVAGLVKSVKRRLVKDGRP